MDRELALKIGFADGVRHDDMLYEAIMSDVEIKLWTSVVISIISACDDD